MVVVPAADRDEVLEAAVQIEEADAATVAEIRQRGRQSRA
jgi:regulator of RNase E activity RraA